MQPYPYSNYPNYNSNNQYAYSNHLYQQPYLGQYGNTNLGKYSQNLNINVSQSTSTKPTSNKKPVKKVEASSSSSSSSEDEEEQKSESDASNSNDEDQRSKSQSDSDEKESDKSKTESSDDGNDASDNNSEKSNEDTDEKPTPEIENNDLPKSYPELKERVKVFRNITQELDDLEDFLKNCFQYFPSEDSETAISERFTRK